MSKNEKSVPLDIRRKVIANMTSAGWRAIPHVCYVYEADATELLTEHKRLNSSGRHAQKIALNTLLLRAIVEGIHAAPRMNAHMCYNRFLVSGRVDIKESIDINMPVLLPSGEMVTLNLRGFGTKTLDEMTCALADLDAKLACTQVDRALLSVGFSDTLRALRQGRVLTALGRVLGLFIGDSHMRGLPRGGKWQNEGTLSIGEMSQGTLTVSNMGAAVRGTHGSVALLDIIPPQVAAIGIGAVQAKPGVFTDPTGVDAIGVRSILPITVAFDHRALDFGDIAPMINRLDDIFKSPAQIHGW